VGQVLNLNLRVPAPSRFSKGLDLDFSILESPATRDITAGSHLMRVLGSVQNCDLHEGESKSGPLQTKGSGTRKFKVWSTRRYALCALPEVRGCRGRAFDASAYVRALQGKISV
jgi:hypothetical protein